MAQIRGFVAYPSDPELIGQTIEAAVEQITHSANAALTLQTWRASDIFGHFIGSEITQDIGSSDFLVADVSVLNFNVTYEVGFAIGRRKRLLLVRLSALKESEEARALGIFDTIGHKSYENSADLATVLKSVVDLSPIELGIAVPNRAAPVYLLLPRFKTDLITHVVSRVKKAKLGFRSFDPVEYPRLSAIEAIKNVVASHGVLLPLLPSELQDANLHNLRAAFLAGLAMGTGKLCYILQLGAGPVPIDYRDLVKPTMHPNEIDAAINEFATDVIAAFQQTEPVIAEPSTFLAQLDLGASAAENEIQDLAGYYIPTDAFKRALRGEARMIVGRKGSGKSALFFQIRDKLRENKRNVVLDLKPDGYQLLKFKHSVLQMLEGGTYQHTITAFWEYLLLLEICNKVLDNDRFGYGRDRRLEGPYRALADSYASSEYVTEGDFSERMAQIIRNIENNYQAKYRDAPRPVLSNPEVTELLYLHDLANLRSALEEYLQFKDAVWILIDNLDKGWPPHGIANEDLTILRCLDDAARKIARDLAKRHVETHALVFLRQDVYELLVSETSDRGKEARVSLDWTDPDLLREMLRRRFLYNGAELNSKFEEIWRTICATHVRGEETSQFLIDRCLMRPRYLIDLFNYCRGFAVNLNHSKIGLDDIEKGTAAFSDDLVRDIGYEIQDVSPELENVLYAFIDVEPLLRPTELVEVLKKGGISEAAVDRTIEILIWYGVLGIVRPIADPTYIYDHNYNLGLTMGMIRKDSDFVYCVNPAFWKGLAIRA
jgi:hypothetical protein